MLCCAKVLEKDLFLRQHQSSYLFLRYALVFNNALRQYQNKKKKETIPEILSISSCVFVLRAFPRGFAESPLRLLTVESVKTHHRVKKTQVLAQTGYCQRICWNEVVLEKVTKLHKLFMFNPWFHFSFLLLSTQV